jgi:CheY-like chemotaxis protein
MVFGLMKQHGGFVRVYSEPGRGTTVRLYFPTAVTAAERRRSPVPALKLRGDETILVVEDQEMLRRATARALEKIGYQILVAADGEEGLRMLAANPGRVRLVLSDRVMPELGGVEMYQRLRAEGHPVPFLLMSGYAADAGGITPVPKELPVIEKPWTVESLASRIRELLDAPPPA